MTIAGRHALIRAVQAKQTVPSLAAVSLSAMTILSACMSTPPLPSHEMTEPSQIAVPPAPYYGIAWAGDDLVATGLRIDNGTLFEDVVVLFRSDGAEVGRFDAPDKEACVRRTPVGLTRLPTGELAFGATCVHRREGDQPSELFAYELASGALRSLGMTLEPVAEMTWNPSMDRLIYTAEGSLCATLYERTADYHGPLRRSVNLGGRDVPLGEDLSIPEDRCTHHGHAQWPAFSPDGKAFAAMVAAVDPLSGQARIDQPWSLVIVDDDRARVILSDIRYPRGVVWLSDDTLAFAGAIRGEHGLWAMARDGSRLVQLGDERLAHIAIDGLDHLLGLIEDPDPSLDGIEAMQNTLVLYDLSHLE